MNDELQEFTFSSEDFQHIADILRGAYSIRTASGEEDMLLGDFIEAMENADVIYCDDDGEEILDLQPFSFPFLPK